MVSPTALLLIFASLLGIAHASSSVTVTQKNCPSAVAVLNGGFESGKIAPWTGGYCCGSGDPVNLHVVSPGFNKSKRALQLDFSGTNTYGYELQQGLTANVCFGYYYRISFAYNWLNYTGPKDYCSFTFYTGYSSTIVPRHYAINKSGWHFDSYVIRDDASHCTTLPDSLFFDLSCFPSDNLAATPFSLRLDQIKIEILPRSPKPYPHDAHGGC